MENELIEIILLKVLSEHHLKIVDCSMYQGKRHYVPKNLRVSHKWLARAMLKHNPKAKPSNEVQ